jgi:hypothetical protein
MIGGAKAFCQDVGVFVLWLLNGRRTDLQAYRRTANWFDAVVGFVVVIGFTVLIGLILRYLRQ